MHPTPFISEVDQPKVHRFTCFLHIMVTNFPPLTFSMRRCYYNGYWLEIEPSASCPQEKILLLLIITIG